MPTTASAAPMAMPQSCWHSGDTRQGRFDASGAACDHRFSTLTEAQAACETWDAGWCGGVVREVGQRCRGILKEYQLRAAWKQHAILMVSQNYDAWVLNRTLCHNLPSRLPRAPRWVPRLEQIQKVNRSSAQVSDCEAAGRSGSFRMTGRGFPGCPRCQEVPGAGVCPSPGSLVEVIQSFDRTVVLCTGSTCARHTGGLYWPSDVSQKLYVFDTKHVDQLIIDYSRDIAQLIGLGPPGEADPLLLPRASQDIRFAWHRVRTLLSAFETVRWADRVGLESVLIMEGDVRPHPPSQLKPADTARLSEHLRNGNWSVVRLGGYFYHYGKHRPRKAPCPDQCLCATIPTGSPRAAKRMSGETWSALPSRSSRFCEVASGVPANESGDVWTAAKPCLVKDAVAFAVHRRAYHVFKRARRTALAALQEAVDITRQLRPTMHRLEPINDTLGLSQEVYDLALPWSDVWLPARLDNLYVLPVIVEQQMKQGEGPPSSKYFRDACARSPL